MRLYFMRHGESTYNVLGLCNDRIDESVRLTERGKQQAERAAAELSTVRLERIICSPLPRAVETAEIVNAQHGAPLTHHDGIHDWRTGLDGRPVAELYTLIDNDPWNTRIAGGETLREHRARVLGFLHWLRIEPRVDTLIVAHEETLRVVTGHFRSLDDARTLALRFANCEVVIFDITTDI